MPNKDEETAIQVIRILWHRPDEVDDIDAIVNLDWSNVALHYRDRLREAYSDYIDLTPSAPVIVGDKFHQSLHAMASIFEGARLTKNPANERIIQELKHSIAGMSFTSHDVEEQIRKNCEERGKPYEIN